MQAVEFTMDLGERPVLAIPQDIADRLPKAGQARVIILTSDDAGDDAEWRDGAFLQFMRDDSPEDSVYDRYV